MGSPTVHTRGPLLVTPAHFSDPVSTGRKDGQTKPQLSLPNHTTNLPAKPNHKSRCQTKPQISPTCRLQTQYPSSGHIFSACIPTYSVQYVYTRACTSRCVYMYIMTPNEVLRWKVGRKYRGRRGFEPSVLFTFCFRQ